MWADLEDGVGLGFGVEFSSINFILFYVFSNCEIYSRQHSTITKFSSHIAGWTTEGSDFESCKVKNFLFSTSSRPAQGPIQPPIQWVLGVLSQGIKLPGREADNSPPTNAESSWRSA
jgi:hypothetical protein